MKNQSIKILAIFSLSVLLYACKKHTINVKPSNPVETTYLIGLQGNSNCMSVVALNPVTGKVYQLSNCTNTSVYGFGLDYSSNIYYTLNAINLQSPTVLTGINILTKAKTEVNFPIDLQPIEVFNGKVYGFNKGTFYAYDIASQKLTGYTKFFGDSGYESDYTFDKKNGTFFINASINKVSYLLEVDCNTGSLKKSIPLPRPLSGMVLNPNDGKIYGEYYINNKINFASLDTASGLVNVISPMNTYSYVGDTRAIEPKTNTYYYLYTDSAISQPFTVFAIDIKTGLAKKLADYHYVCNFEAYTTTFDFGGVK